MSKNKPDKPRYLHINLETLDMVVKNTEPTKADLNDVLVHYIAIIKIANSEFMEINADGNFESIKKDFINE